MTAPNILFIMADQMSAKAMPMYGHPVVRTPTLSALAEAGVVFDQAICNSPLCGPSRLSMMSGRLPSAVGAYDNAVEFSAATPTFAHYVRRLGYRTCLSGKMHFVGPDQLHGFETRLTTDIYPSDFGWTPNWAEPDAKVRFQDMQNVMETGPCARSLQIDYDEEACWRACNWLYDQARETDRPPFLLTVSFTSPHDPYVALPEFWDLYPDEVIDLPTVGPVAPEATDAHSSRLRAHYSIDEAEVTEDVLRRARRGYYASISYVDAKVAELMHALRRSGLAKDTIVIFASDHGDMMGERGLFYKKSFFEWSIRVPLIFWAPGRWAPGRVSSAVSLLDMLPTFVDIAGGDTREILAADGRSLCPAAEGLAMPDRMIAAEFLAEGVFEPTFLLRDDRYKYYHSAGDPPLLYDLQADPQELENLADAPEAAAVRQRFAKAAAAQWDSDALKSAIIDDQNRRRLIAEAHRVGAPPVWDFQPFTDASAQYVRAGKWTVEVEAAAHLDVSET